MGALLLAAFALLAYQKQKRDEQEYARKAAERRIHYFEKVKSGDDGTGVAVTDPQLIVMLANDPVCAANLVHLNLDMAELDAPEFQDVSRLANVETIYIYSSSGVNELIADLAPMPSVRELSLDTKVPSHESIRRLPTVFPKLEKLSCEWVVDAATEQLMRKVLPEVDLEIPHPARDEPN
jgi:hypothetical protein